MCREKTKKNDRVRTQVARLDQKKRREKSKLAEKSCQISRYKQ